MRRKRPLSLFAVIAATTLSVLVSACSSAGSSSGNASATTASTAGGSGGSAGCKTPTGPTVDVMAILEEDPSLQVTQDGARAAMAARIKAINCAGGLGAAGDKVAAIYCISNYDPNAVDACAREAVSNKSVVAVAGGGVAEGTPDTILAQGGVPVIPQTYYPNPGDSTTFAVVPSGAQLGPGEPVMGCKLGYTKISLLLIQSPSAAGVPALDNTALASFGCPSLIRTVEVPETATDVSSEVVAAAQGADAIVLAVADNQAIAAFKDKEQLGITIPFITNAGTMTAQTIQAAGSAADGVLIESQAYLPANDSSTPGAAQFRSEMAAVGDSDLVDGWSQGTWITLDLLQTAANGLTTVNRTTLLDSLRKVTDFDAGGQIPAVNLTKPAPNSAFPRLFNDQWAPAVVKNGQVVALDNSTLGNFVYIEKPS